MMPSNVLILMLAAILVPRGALSVARQGYIPGPAVRPEVPKCGACRGRQARVMPQAVSQAETIVVP